MIDPTRTEDLICDPQALMKLPIFPLPGVTFFPHTLLPLHVFEPRYRQMTENVLDGDGLLGVACVVGEDERIAPVGGLGRMLHSEKLPDGRYHILLQGLGRVWLDETESEAGILYRTACASLIADVDDAAAAAEQEVATIHALITRLVEVSPETAAQVGDLPLRIENRGVLADVLCAALVQDEESRLAAMMEPNVPRRLQYASDALATLLLESASESSEFEH